MAEFFSILYFSFLVVADIEIVIAILWRAGNLCIFLRATIYVTLQSSVIFKTIAVVIITLKIRYPFRYQLRYLKHVPIISCAIWLAVFSSHIFDLVRVFSRTGGPYLDIMCSCFDCHKKSNLVHFYVSLFDLSCI